LIDLIIFIKRKKKNIPFEKRKEFKFLRVIIEKIKENIRKKDYMYVKKKIILAMAENIILYNIWCHFHLLPQRKLMKYTHMTQNDYIKTT
jgi:hypothetical protein